MSLPCDAVPVRAARTEAKRDSIPLNLAAQESHLPVVQYLCEQGADKEARGEYVMTPLHFAALKSHFPVVQYLCEQGADKKARDDIAHTPLHWAELHGKSAVVQYFEGLK